MVKVLIDYSKCSLCRLCIEYCPTYVFSIKNNKVVVDNNKCVECYGCIPLCPEGAILIISEDP